MTQECQKTPYRKSALMIRQRGVRQHSVSLLGAADNARGAAEDNAQGLESLGDAWRVYLLDYLDGPPRIPLLTLLARGANVRSVHGEAEDNAQGLTMHRGLQCTRT